MGVAAVIAIATVLGLTPQQKAALVVVSGLPATPGVAGVIVQSYNRDAPRPPGAFVVTAAFIGLLVSFPFATLAIWTVLYLASIPVGIARYRQLAREVVASPVGMAPGGAGKAAA